MDLQRVSTSGNLLGGVRCFKAPLLKPEDNFMLSSGLRARAQSEGSSNAVELTIAYTGHPSRGTLSCDRRVSRFRLK